MNNAIVDGVRLAYRVDGPDDAPSVVLVNSLGTDLGMWQAQIPPLSRNFRVVRYDCRGHGRSDLSNEPVTIARLGRDLLALLDHLEIERTHICGLSLGGMTALWLAAQHPERISRAVFANTAARIGTTAGWDARIEMVQAGGMAAVRDMLVARFFSADFRARRPDIVQIMGDTLEAMSPEGYIAACASLRDADLHDIISAIRLPSLILAGAVDEATPPEQSEELQASIAGSKLVVLQQTAHLSNVEQPDVFNHYLVEFLNDA